MQTTIPVDRADGNTRYIAEQYLKTTPHISNVTYDSDDSTVTIEHDGDPSTSELRAECRTAGFSLGDDQITPSLFEKVSTITSL